MPKVTIDWNKFNRNKMEINNEMLDYVVIEPNITFDRVRTLKITKLKDEHLSQLSQIDKLIASMPNLTEIIIDNNAFVPLSIFNCKNVENLTIINTKTHSIKDIENGLSSLSKLKQLKMDKTIINQLPIDIEENDNLEYISVSNAGLENIPIGITRLPKLQTLRLESNKIKEIPKELFNMPSLEVLDVSDNQIFDLQLPDAPTSKMTHLSVRKNKISSFPNQISQLKTIEFDASENTITNLKDIPKSLYFNFNSNPLIEIHVEKQKLPFIITNLEPKNTELSPKVKKLIDNCKQSTKAIIKTSINTGMSNIPKTNTISVDEVVSITDKPLTADFYEQPSCNELFNAINVDIMDELDKFTRNDITPETKKQLEIDIRENFICKNLPIVERLYNNNRNNEYLERINQFAHELCEVELGKDKKMQILL